MPYPDEFPYNPQPGRKWQPGLQYANSFAGIIAAFNDLRVENSQDPKEYPHNYMGIILALVDLQANGDASIGDGAPGWGLIEEPPGSGNWYPEYSPIPRDGQIWFDTRQGRLFIWITDDWYQTNGADGLSYVQNDIPNSAVLGSSWFEPTSQKYYVYDGSTWQLIDGSSGASYTTGNLPLANPTTISAAEILPPTDGFSVQSDYNNWAYTALNNIVDVLEDAGNASVTVSDTAPANAEAGNLWFDSVALEMLIYYKPDADPGTWVPVSIPNSLQAEIGTLTAQLNQTTTSFNTRVDAVEADVLAHKTTHATALAAIQSTVTALSSTVDRIDGETVDFTPYATNATVTTTAAAIRAELAAAVAAIDLTPFSTTTALSTAVSTLEATLAAKATTTELNTAIAAVTAAIPDISGKADTTYVDSSIAAIDLSIQTITDTVAITKTDIAKATLDYSAGTLNGIKALKFKTLADASNVGDKFTTFGTTDKYWEYAWEFAGKEDFSWIHGTNGKVASVNSTGLVAKEVTIADYSVNNANGLVLQNTIEVGARLQKYQTTFEAIRSGVNSSTDYASLKTNLLAALAEV